MHEIASVAGFLASATQRQDARTSDARAGAVYQRVTVDGEAYFVKQLSPASDWIMRVTGDHVHRPYLIWQAGVMDDCPSCIDHTVVAMDVAGSGDGAVLKVGGFALQRKPQFEDEFDRLLEALAAEAGGEVPDPPPTNGHPTEEQQEVQTR